MWETLQKHGEKQSQKTEECLILPTLTQLTQQFMENRHEGNDLSSPTEWEKHTLNDDEDDDDDDDDDDVYTLLFFFDSITIKSPASWCNK